MDYAELADVVNELILDTGRSVVLERLSATPPDSARPWRGPVAQTVASSLTAPATFVPASGAGLGKELVSPELLKTVEQVCMTGPSTVFDIEAATTVTDGAQRWRVEWVQTLKPGSVALLHVIGLKK